MMNRINKSRLLTVSGVLVALLWAAVVGVYVSVARPEFPGGLLLTATVVAGFIITMSLGAAVYFGARATQFEEVINKPLATLWLGLVACAALIIGGFTAMFTVFWWPVWFLAIFN